MSPSPCLQVARSPCPLLPADKSPGYNAAPLRGYGLFVTLSPGLPVSLSPCHPVTQSPCLLVSPSPGLLVAFRGPRSRVERASGPRSGRTAAIRSRRRRSLCLPVPLSPSQFFPVLRREPLASLGVNSAPPVPCPERKRGIGQVAQQPAGRRSLVPLGINSTSTQ